MDMWSYSPTRVVILQEDDDDADNDSDGRTVIGNEEGTASADVGAVTAAITLETVVEEDDENGEQQQELQEDRLFPESVDDDGDKSGEPSPRQRDSEVPVRR